MYLVDSILKGKFYMKYTFQSNENNPKKSFERDLWKKHLCPPKRHHVYSFGLCIQIGKG